MIYKTISLLAASAPAAIFTKKEAAEKANQIIAYICDNDDSDDYCAEMAGITVKSEDFDDMSNDVDVLLDDVRFITFDTIDSVINSLICNVQS